MDRIPSMESGVDKLKRRMREEPLVPLGCLATAVVLTGGLLSFRRAADAKTQQRYMRGRVIAQGATVVAMALGSILTLKQSSSTS